MGYAPKSRQPARTGALVHGSWAIYIVVSRNLATASEDKRRRFSSWIDDSAIITWYLYCDSLCNNGAVSVTQEHQSLRHMQNSKTRMKTHIRSGPLHWIERFHASWYSGLLKIIFRTMLQFLNCTFLLKTDVKKKQLLYFSLLSRKWTGLKC
jgi:hypothetical protein